MRRKNVTVNVKVRGAEADQVNVNVNVDLGGQKPVISKKPIFGDDSISRKYFGVYQEKYVSPDLRRVLGLDEAEDLTDYGAVYSSGIFDDGPLDACYLPTKSQLDQFNHMLNACKKRGIAINLRDYPRTFRDYNLVIRSMARELEKYKKLHEPS